MKTPPEITALLNGEGLKPVLGVLALFFTALIYAVRYLIRVIKEIHLESNKAAQDNADRLERAFKGWIKDLKEKDK